MADITNPEAIRFVNEQVRPLCEKVRALKAEVDAASVLWYAGLNTVITNTADPIDDGREAEGVSRLTGADVTNAVGQLIAAANVNAEIISKPCVRALQAG